jgi:hypothetical protein
MRGGSVIDLEMIESRLKTCLFTGSPIMATGLLEKTIPALIAEVRSLRARLSDARLGAEGDAVPNRFGGKL